MAYKLEESTTGLHISAENVIASGVLAGGDLYPNYVPALLGIHHAVTASNFEYLGGTQQNLLSKVKWSSAGNLDVTTNLYYNGDQLHEIKTECYEGEVLKKRATEHFEWSGDNLTGYTITFE